MTDEHPDHAQDDDEVLDVDPDTMARIRQAAHDAPAGGDYAVPVTVDELERTAREAFMALNRLAGALEALELAPIAAVMVRRLNELGGPLSHFTDRARRLELVDKHRAEDDAQVADAYAVIRGLEQELTQARGIEGAAGFLTLIPADVLVTTVEQRFAELRPITERGRLNAAHAIGLLRDELDRG